ncbi:MAG: hypothetical protein KatS3mg121_0921 [Gammaproteobacteria bacterium]|nr:MAG: hypothetical protein KatS3mg121_0921 [Gammaproteobacteria bacterium]
MMRLPFLFGLLAWVAAATAPGQPAAGLAEIERLVRAGAPELALARLDALQPPAAENPAGWWAVERRRWAIMRRWEMWNALAERLAAQPLPQDREARREWLLEAANAHLNLGQGAAARRALRRLIWQPPALHGPGDLSLYRRLVVRAHLTDGALEDARRAMLRYEQDRGEADGLWAKLEARILLASGRAEEAAAVLAPDGGDAEAAALAWQARLAAGAAPGPIAEAAARAAAKATEAADRARFWAVAAHAAQRAGDAQGTLAALEAAVADAPALPTQDALFRLDGDALWRAYLDQARALGNRLRFLVGDDAAWLAEAERQGATPLARALLALVMDQGATEAARAEACRRYMATLSDETRRIALLRALFVEGGERSVPEPAAYALVDAALAANDMPTATRLMANLARPPAGADDLQWSLLRARVLLLGGRVEEGIEALSALVEAVPDDRARLDRVTQVVFDLQTLGRHREALALFERLHQRAADPGLQRELLFWQAESHQALGEPVQAAAHYLASALWLDGRGDDPWGQTARFHAAEALVAAGFLGDAERLYRRLLAQTADPARRAVIRVKLQELWLRRPAGEGALNRP